MQTDRALSIIRVTKNIMVPVISLHRAGGAVDPIESIGDF